MRSDEVQEILDAFPHWIIRWGITVILMILIVLLAGSYFFRYPDIIRSRVTILPENPPVPVMAKATGKIDTLFVEDGQMVEEGALLGIIENPADFIDAFALVRELDSIRLFFDRPEGQGKISCSEDYSIGEYQSFLSSFSARIKEYNIYLQFNPTRQRVQTLKKQVADYTTYYERLKDQAEVLEEDYAIRERQYRRDSALHDGLVISDLEFENSKGALLKEQFTYRNALTSLVSTDITINNLQQQIRELEVTTAETEEKLQASLKEHFDNLVNQLKTWELTYVLKSPIAGNITFNAIWAANQNVPAGSVVFSVVPADPQTIIGKALVPVAGAGKVAPGQRVIIKLDNFPHMEFGYLEGRISTLSKVSVATSGGNFYTAEVILPSGMVTSYHKVLPSDQEMLGMAGIVTKERRLIERLLAPLVSLFRERLTGG